MRGGIKVNKIFVDQNWHFIATEICKFRKFLAVGVGNILGVWGQSHQLPEANGLRHQNLAILQFKKKRILEIFYSNFV